MGQTPRCTSHNDECRFGLVACSVLILRQDSTGHGKHLSIGAHRLEFSTEKEHVHTTFASIFVVLTGRLLSRCGPSAAKRTGHLVVFVRYITSFGPILSQRNCAGDGGVRSPWVYICTVQHECPAFNTDLGGKQRNGEHVSEAHLVWTRVGQEVSSSSDVQASSTAGLGWRAAEQLPHQKRSTC